MTDSLKKISVDELPNEFAITDSDGNVLLLILMTESGYVNVDFRGIKTKGARVFKLGGPVQDDGPTMNGKIDVDIPDVEDVPSFLSVDGNIDT